MTIYASIYHLPITFCEHLERVMNKFWWESKPNGGGGMHWLSWHRMTKTKAQGGLGFKRLHDFNLALLAKQGWRMLTNPNSTVAKLYKARYFPHGSFLHASLGANPSYCWRSILAGVPILQRGCYKRIGNGRGTHIWDDPWLPHDAEPRPETARPEHHGMDTVSTLIDPETEDWDVPLLEELFTRRDVDLILKIPISPGFDDTWCWRGDIHGNYSVRHGYKLTDMTDSIESLEFVAWSSIWKLKIPPKFINFLWRCARVILPVRSKLSQRGIHVDIVCPLCNASPETMRHLFLDCDYTKPLWNVQGTVLQIEGDESFEHWLSHCMSVVDLGTKLRCLSLCWAIWKHRNDLVWNHKPWSHDGVCMLVGNLFTEWMEMGAPSTDSASLTLQNNISVGNLLTIHVDASILPGNHRGSYGAVVHDTHGRYLAAKNGRVRCLSDPHLAEAMAIKEALSWAMEQGWHRLVLLSDCQMVCNMLKANRVDYSYAGCVIREIQDRMRHFDIVSVRYVRRSENELAHELARAASSQSGSCVWFHSYPLCIQHLININ